MDDFPTEKVYLDKKSPLESARLFLASRSTDAGLATDYFHCGDPYHYNGTCYRILENDALRKDIYRWAETAWCWAGVGDNLREEPFHPNPRKVSDIIDAMRAEAHLPSSVPVPSWLDGRDAKATDYLPCANGIVHLPSFLEGKPNYFTPSTPAFFTTAALDYAFDERAPTPEKFLNFLVDILEDDGEAMDLLQEWFGYALTPDTSQQKILLIHGPKRSGKGTAGRILTAMLGRHNVAGPTLASFQQNFGLQPLICKSLALIADARLSGKSDTSIIAERLLSISGEDSLTIDIKNRPPITTKLSARLVVLTNELPKLSDASGALASRFCIVRLKNSFFGKENTALTGELLKELPGILLWALDGWKRLRSQGRFTVPTSSAAAARALEDLASPIGAFIRDICIVRAGQFVAVDELFDRWKSWCESEGRDHPGTKQSFGRDLSSAVPGLTISQPRDSSGSRFRAYEGIGIGIQCGGGAV
ncbi:MAG TPA: phage/plasmid primase, P4 family [Phycisphaerae bacterium]|nr:phage/plasmid primase, P4 family [Phycisphaerae bacterium]